MSQKDEFESQLEKVITRVHQYLSSNFTLVAETRDLNSSENELLLELEPNSLKYRQLAGALAIESYTDYIVKLLSDCEPLLEITTLIFN